MKNKRISICSIVLLALLLNHNNELINALKLTPINNANANQVSSKSNKEDYATSEAKISEILVKQLHKLIQQNNIDTLLLSNDYSISTESNSNSNNNSNSNHRNNSSNSSNTTDSSIETIGTLLKSSQAEVLQERLETWNRLKDDANSTSNIDSSRNAAYQNVVYNYALGNVYLGYLRYLTSNYAAAIASLEESCPVIWSTNKGSIHINNGWIYCYYSLSDLYINCQDGDANICINKLKSLEASISTHTPWIADSLKYNYIPSSSLVRLQATRSIDASAFAIASHLIAMTPQVRNVIVTETHSMWTIAGKYRSDIKSAMYAFISAKSKREKMAIYRKYVSKVDEMMELYNAGSLVSNTIASPEAESIMHTIYSNDGNDVNRTSDDINVYEASYIQVLLRSLQSSLKQQLLTETTYYLKSMENIMNNGFDSLTSHIAADSHTTRSDTILGFDSKESIYTFIEATLQKYNSDAILLHNKKTLQQQQQQQAPSGNTKNTRQKTTTQRHSAKKGKAASNTKKSDYADMKDEQYTKNNGSGSDGKSSSWSYTIYVLILAVGGMFVSFKGSKSQYGKQQGGRKSGAGIDAASVEYPVIEHCLAVITTLSAMISSLLMLVNSKQDTNTIKAATAASATQIYDDDYLSSMDGVATNKRRSNNSLSNAISIKSKGTSLGKATKKKDKSPSNSGKASVTSPDDRDSNADAATLTSVESTANSNDEGKSTSTYLDYSDYSDAPIEYEGDWIALSNKTRKKSSFDYKKSCSRPPSSGPKQGFTVESTKGLKKNARPSVPAAKFISAPLAASNRSIDSIISGTKHTVGLRQTLKASSFNGSANTLTQSSMEIHNSMSLKSNASCTSDEDYSISSTSDDTGIRSPPHEPYYQSHHHTHNHHQMQQEQHMPPVYPHQYDPAVSANHMYVQEYYVLPPSPIQLMYPVMHDQINQPVVTNDTTVFPHPQYYQYAPPPMLSPAQYHYNDQSMMDILRSQVEYYFSEENLRKDKFLRGIMNDQGYVYLTEILAFRRIMSMNVTPSFVYDSIARSNRLEMLDDTEGGNLLNTLIRAKDFNL